MAIYDDEHSAYIADLFAEQDDALQHIYEETQKRGLSAIRAKPEEGHFFCISSCGPAGRARHSQSVRLVATAAFGLHVRCRQMVDASPWRKMPHTRKSPRSHSELANNGTDLRS